MAPRLIIVDDNPIFRTALKSVLMGSNLEITAEACNGLEAIEKVEQLKPDILLLDISIPNLNGIEVLKQLRKSHPDLKIIMLTMHRHFLDMALKAGANGYFTKDCRPNQLLAGIDQVLGGETFICTE